MPVVEPVYMVQIGLFEEGLPPSAGFMFMVSPG